jgi:SMC interacting uncharacterized protein involved in chromosome segregation
MIVLLCSISAVNSHASDTSRAQNDDAQSISKQADDIEQRKHDLEQRYRQLLDEKEGFRKMVKNPGQLTQADQNELTKLAESLAEKTNRLQEEINELQQDIDMKNKKEDLKILLEKTKNMPEYRPLPKIRRKKVVV